MKITDLEIEKYLAKEMEGRLYVHHYIKHVFGEIWASSDYYAVLDGVVYRINNDGGLEKSGDTLFNTQNECKHIGNYKSNDLEHVSHWKVVKYSAVKKFFKAL
jgi:hypothetical protein